MNKIFTKFKRAWNRMDKSERVTIVFSMGITTYFGTMWASTTYLMLGWFITAHVVALVSWILYPLAKNLYQEFKRD